MNRKFLVATCVAAIAALFPVGSAFAEDPMPAKGLLSQEGPDLWRGSKLIGLDIFGPDNKKIGDISDVLMSHDGKAASVIIGVGGFLGIGEKDIAIPFDQVAFADQPMHPVPAQSAALQTNDGATGGGMAPATATGLGSPPADTNGNSMAPATTGSVAAPAAGQPTAMQRSTTYPDHGLISLTAEQLKQAPAFQYAK